MSHCESLGCKRYSNILTLTGKQRRYLRGLSHGRKPVVTIGNKGLNESVMAEIEGALTHHELLKIKLPALARQERERLLASVCAATGADLVQTLGRMGVIFREAEPPVIQLPG